MTSATNSLTPERRRQNETVTPARRSVQPVVRPDNEPYFVEGDNNGCRKCQCGQTWTIIDPDGVAAGQSWGDKSEAEYICELLNDAYQRGKGSNTDSSDRE